MFVNNIQWSDLFVICLLNLHKTGTFITRCKNYKRDSINVVEITNNEKSKAYETEKRKRVFIPSWTTTYPWLQNGISGITCTVCTKFDKTDTFITGCKSWASPMSHLAIFVSNWLQKTVAGDNSGGNIFIIKNYLNSIKGN